MRACLFSALKKNIFLVSLLCVFGVPLALAEEDEKKEHGTTDAAKKEKKAKEAQQKSEKDAAKKPAKKEGEESSEAKKESPGGEKAVLDPIFVPIDYLVIPVIQNRRLVASYTIGLVLEGTSYEASDEVRLLIPQIRDAFLEDLYAVFSVVWTPEVNVFLRDLKTRLLKVAQKVAEAKRIKSVLIQSFDEKHLNVS